MDNFNLKKYLAENKLLKEGLEQDVLNFWDVQQDDASQSNGEYKAKWDTKFFIDNYPEHKGKEQEINDIAKNHLTENSGPHVDLGFDPEQKDPAEHIRVLAKELETALKTKDWGMVSGVLDDLEYLTHPDKFPSTWIKAENDLTENESTDLIKKAWYDGLHIGRTTSDSTNSTKKWEQFKIENRLN